MILLLGFMFGVIVLSLWEYRGGPRWRTPVALVACAIVGFAFLSQRVL
jgi:hypothetical protein